jgi:hypothetical protein
VGQRRMAAFNQILHIAIIIWQYAIVVKNWIWRVLIIVTITEGEARRVLYNASVKIPLEVFS